VLMNTHAKNDLSVVPSDTHIIKRLNEAAENDDVFAATRDWSMKRMRMAVQSRGDLFDRKSIVAFEQDGQEVLRLCMCDLPVTIGRGEKVDCRLQNDGISRLQCRLEQVGNLVRLSDAGSKNGTLLNGRKIKAEELCDGDIVQIGSLILRVKRT